MLLGTRKRTVFVQEWLDLESWTTPTYNKRGLFVAQVYNINRTPAGVRDLHRLLFALLPRWAGRGRRCAINRGDCKVRNRMRTARRRLLDQCCLHLLTHPHVKGQLSLMVGGHCGFPIAVSTCFQWNSNYCSDYVFNHVMETLHFAITQRHYICFLRMQLILNLVPTLSNGFHASWVVNCIALEWGCNDFIFCFYTQ